MRAFLSAVILWLFLGAPALAQSAACTVLSRMRLAEVALQGLAEGVGEGESHAALLLLIREVGPAGGLDPEFLAAFLSAHEGAVAALAGGARPETVLAGRALRETGARVARDLGLFGCAGRRGRRSIPAGASWRVTRWGRGRPDWTSLRRARSPRRPSLFPASRWRRTRPTV